MMPCQYLGRSPVSREWHRLRCPECRLSRSADARLASGIQRLNAEAAPPAGLEQALAAFGATARHGARGQRWTTRRIRRFFSAGAFATAATVCSVGWLSYIEIDPKIDIPAPAMPSPNAFDVLANAAKAIPASEKTVQKGPFTDNIYEHSRLAYAVSNTKERPKNQAEDITFPADHFYSLLEKEELIQEYGSALDLTRKAFAFPYMAPPIRSAEASPSYFPDYRQLQRAFILESQVKAAHHDYAGAVNCALDAVQLGAQIERGAFLIGKLVGFACEIGGRAEAWRYLDRLDGPQSLAAARRMEEIEKLRVPFAATLEEEKRATLASIRAYFSAHNWRTRFARDRTSAAPSPLVDLAVYIRMLPFSKARIVEDFTSIMDAYIEDAKRPYPKSFARPLRSPGNERFQRDIVQRMNFDPVAAVFVRDAENARFREVEGPETQNALLMTSFAIHAYEREHDGPPKSLETLVPKYLSSVPADPFGQGEPLRYRYAKRRTISADGGKTWHYALYSVGPDCKDDGAAPIRFTQNLVVRGVPRPSDTDHAVDSNCTGDIVAEINMR